MEYNQRENVGDSAKRNSHEGHCPFSSFLFNL